MFTGIITDLGRIEAVTHDKGGLRLTIGVGFDLDDVALGASIAHNGVCLTIVDKKDHHYCLDVSPETLSLTTLGNWQVGDKVNIERALKIGDELGGHMVSGHVDGVAELLSITPDGDYYRLKLKAPDPLHRFIAPKGSVALDGISLTINEVDGFEFGVSIIPHTWNHTHMSRLSAGAFLNLEIDRLARYAARWSETR